MQFYICVRVCVLNMNFLFCKYVFISYEVLIFVYSYIEYLFMNNLYA